MLYNFILRLPPFWTVLPRFAFALFTGRLLFFFEGGILLSILRPLFFFFLAAIPGWFYVRRRMPLLNSVPSVIAGVIFGWGFWMIAAELLAIFHLLRFWPLMISWLAVTLVCRFLPARKKDSCEYHLPWKIQDRWEKVLWTLGLLLVIFITFWTFYHALVFPVVYHDSLILYVDYGEQTYLEGGFPVIVCGQVGIGLGANYPHLFPLTAASMGTLFGSWADRDAQFLSPFAGLLATLLIYHLMLRISRRHIVAMMAALLFRSIPYAAIYLIYATDYAVAMLLTALFLWSLWLYLARGRTSGLEGAALAVAIAMHLNYMMGILWLPLLLAPVIRAWSQKQKASLKETFPRGVWLCFLFAALLACPWYIRNWIVTGNPVYAFFPEIFGGKNINLEVLESCFHEWRAHGDGIGRFGPTLMDKLRGLDNFLFFETNYHWKYGPVLTAFALPGLALALRRSRPLIISAFVVFASVVVYHFVLADLYLYHTLMITPALAVFAAMPLLVFPQRLVRCVFCGVILITSLLTGAAPAITGGKLMWFPPQPLAIEIPGAVRAQGGPQWRQVLRQQFLYLTLRDSWLMWNYMNENIAPAKVLTHENRHHYVRRDIEFIGLDDCNLTHLYDQPFEEVVKHLRKRGIGYYLYVPFEDHHPILRRLGVHGENLETYYEPVHFEGNQRLYRLREEV
jgi:4-amino-4-deoxy-L-arabinose transferase-like glycosyltransferase